MMDGIKDQVFRNLIEEKITKQLETIGKSLTEVISDYEYIYGDERAVLYSIIVESFIDNYKSDTNEIKFDFEHFLKNTPNEAKQLVFDRLVEGFSKQISISDIKNSPKGE